MADITPAETAAAPSTEVSEVFATQAKMNVDRITATATVPSAAALDGAGGDAASSGGGGGALGLLRKLKQQAVGEATVIAADEGQLAQTIDLVLAEVKASEAAAQATQQQLSSLLDAQRSFVAEREVEMDRVETISGENLKLKQLLEAKDALRASEADARQKQKCEVEAAVAEAEGLRGMLGRVVTDLNVANDQAKKAQRVAAQQTENLKQTYVRYWRLGSGIGVSDRVRVRVGVTD